MEIPFRHLNDEDFSVISTTNGIEEFTGFPYTDFLNNSVRTFESIINPDDVEKIHSKIEEAVINRSRYEVAYKIISRDKKIRWMFERGQGIFNKSNELIYLDAVLLDITDFIEAQMELEKYKDHLEYMVEQKTEELNMSLKTLKHTQEKLIESEKMAALGMLVSGVAHEINTPIGIGITAISHLLEINNNLKKDIEVGSLKKRELFSYLDDSSESIGLTMNNLKKAADIVSKFKQISVNQYSEERKVFRIVEYAKIMLNNYRTEDGEVDVTIDLDYSEDFEINSYQHALSDIFYHLISNSIQHGFKHRESGNILIKISKESDVIIFIYNDNGCGVEEEGLKKIFEPFYTSNRSSGNTGLGMNIIYNLVTQMLKGSISCVSSPDQGFEVTMILPIN